jgi:acyl-CoA thioesterase I
MQIPCSHISKKTNNKVALRGFFVILYSMKVSTLFFIGSLVVFLCVSAFTLYFVFFSEKKESPNSSETEVRERRIVAFGDSLTYGYNLPIDDSYPSKLQKKLDQEGYFYKVINLGVNGETTEQGLARLQSVLSYEPDIVLLEFGANDYLKRLPPENARKNLEEMVKFFDKNGVKVIPVGVEPHPLLPLPNKEAFGVILPDLAKAYGLSLVPSFLDGVLFEDGLVLEDKIHPNAAGYQKALDENLWPVLEKHLVK